MNPLRLLFLDAGLSMRGGQWQTLRLAGGLCRHGHTVTLLTPRLSALSEEAVRAGLDVRPLHWSAVRSLSAGADLVHAHDARSHSLAALWARAPLVVARRVAFPLRSGWASSWKYGRARHYLAVSAHVREVLEKGGVPAGRITVVPDGVPLLPRAAPGPDVVVAGFADPAKGTALGLQAAALAGAPCRAAAALPRDLDGAAVFVYVTYSEGLGSAILLAMSAGVPVVASRVGGVPEIVRDGVTGLASPNTPDQIAACIRRLLDQPALADRLARQARQMVEQEFSAELMIERTLHVYRQVLQ